MEGRRFLTGARSRPRRQFCLWIPPWNPWSHPCFIERPRGRPAPELEAAGLFLSGAATDLLSHFSRLSLSLWLARAACDLGCSKSPLEKLPMLSTGEGTFEQVAGEAGIFSFSCFVWKVDIRPSSESTFYPGDQAIFELTLKQKSPN